MFAEIEMTNVNAAVFTYEDYRNTSDDQRYEVLDGELVILPTPNIAHQKVLFRMARLLEDFVLERELGEVFIAATDVVLSDTNVVQPDIIFVSTERKSIVDADNIKGSPDLVVEIISPNNPKRDLVRKRGIYARHGVGEYWIADPEALSIRVMTLEGSAYREAEEFGMGDVLTSSALEGLELEVGNVFTTVTRA